MSPEDLVVIDLSYQINRLLVTKIDPHALMRAGHTPTIRELIDPRQLDVIMQALAAAQETKTAISGESG